MLHSIFNQSSLCFNSRNSNLDKSKKSGVALFFDTEYDIMLDEIR